MEKYVRVCYFNERCGTHLCVDQDGRPVWIQEWRLGAGWMELDPHRLVGMKIGYDTILPLDFTITGARIIEEKTDD